MALKQTPSQIRALSKDLVNEFDTAFQRWLTNEENAWYRNLTTEYVTSEDNVTIPFYLDDWSAQWREIGEAAQYTTPQSFYSTARLKKIADGLEMNIVDVESQTVGPNLLRRARNLASRAPSELTYRLVHALENGDTDSYYTMHDGKQLFANDHEIRGNTWDNLLTGTLSASDPTAYDNAVTQLMRVPFGVNGRYLDTSGATFYLIVPPQLRHEARKLLNNSLLAQSNFNTQNPRLNEAELVVANQLSDANDFYVAMTVPGSTPFLDLRHSVYGNFRLIPQIEEDMNHVLDNDKYRWVLKSFREVFPVAFWQIVKVTNS